MAQVTALLRGNLSGSPATGATGVGDKRPIATLAAQNK